MWAEFGEMFITMLLYRRAVNTFGSYNYLGTRVQEDGTVGE